MYDKKPANAAQSSCFKERNNNHGNKLITPGVPVVEGDKTLSEMFIICLRGIFSTPHFTAKFSPEKLGGSPKVTLRRSKLVVKDSDSTAFQFAKLVLLLLRLVAPSLWPRENSCVF